MASPNERARKRDASEPGQQHTGLHSSHAPDQDQPAAAVGHRQGNNSQQQQQIDSESPLDTKYQLRVAVNGSSTSSPPGPSSNSRHRAMSPSPSAAGSVSGNSSRTHSFSLDQHHKQQQQDEEPDDERDSSSAALLRSAEQAVSARLLPPLLLLVMVSYIDRTNLSFASIQLSQDLNLSSTMYGVGSGVFFLAYALGQIPSNLLLMRFGGPTWLAAITVAWGAVASAFALVRGPVSFIMLRLLLGLAESGSLPGTWYYISLFYPPHRTTVPYSLIETGITVSQVIAAPFAAGLLLLDGVAGLQGWQWLFLVEGLPALILGCFIRYWLPVSVASANFLSLDQRTALAKALAAAVKDDDDADLASPDTALLPQTGDTADTVRISSSGSDLQRKGTAAAAAAAAAKKQPPAAAAAVAPDVATERQSLLGEKHTQSDASDVLIHVSPTSMSPGAAAAAAGCCGSSDRRRLASPGPDSSSSRTNGQKFVAVATNRVVLYAGSWRILHDIPGNGILYWTPKIVQALLIAAGSSAAIGAAAAAPGSSSSSTDDGGQLERQHSTGTSTGAYVVLLSAIPYAAASFFHLANAWHSQKQGERKWHIGITWFGGAVALLLLPAAAAGGLAAATAAADGSHIGISTSASIAAFVLLTIAHIGINGANGVQTGLVAGSIVKQDKALGLALYNMIGNIGSFLGPVVIGVLADATGGYVLAMVLLGFSLAAASVMVVRFKPEKLDRRLQAAVVPS